MTRINVNQWPEVRQVRINAVFHKLPHAAFSRKLFQNGALAALAALFRFTTWQELIEWALICSGSNHRQCGAPITGPSLPLWRKSSRCCGIIRLWHG